MITYIINIVTSIVVNIKKIMSKYRNNETKSYNTYKDYIRLASRPPTKANQIRIEKVYNKIMRNRGILHFFKEEIRKHHNNLEWKK